MKSELENLIEKWESFKPVGHPNVVIWDSFINDAKNASGKDRSKWIKIESKKDLPSKNGHYLVFRGKIVEVMEYFDNGKTRGFIRSGSDYINKYNEIGITHYQPIQKPEPPLF